MTRSTPRTRHLLAALGAALLAPFAPAADRPWEPGAVVAVDAVRVNDGRPEIAWKPRPYDLVVGETVRYIDHAGGDDGAAGTRAAPWKHHPWDAQWQGAADAAAGVDTFVFKGGVVYRGLIEVAASGTAQRPIRFTRDPDWGAGEAVLSGAETVTGWQVWRPEMATGPTAGADAPAPVVAPADPPPPAPEVAALNLLPGGSPDSEADLARWTLFKDWMRGNVEIREYDGRSGLALTGRAILTTTVPAPEAEAVALSGLARLQDFKAGPQAWDQLRLPVGLQDAAGEYLDKPWRSDVRFDADQDWSAFDEAWTLPDGTVTLEVQLAYKAAGGVFDLLDLSLHVVSDEQAKVEVQTDAERWGEIRDHVPELPTPPLAFPAAGEGRLLMAELPAGVVPHRVYGGGDHGSYRAACEPDWEIADPYHWDAEWWHFDSAERVGTFLIQASDERFVGTRADWLGATLWTVLTNGEFSIDGPAGTPIFAFDRGKQQVTFQVQHPKRYPRAGTPYYLTGLPRFLDRVDEWYARDGRIWLRVADGVDPASVAVEAGARNVVVEVRDHDHIEFAGLTFRHANTPDPQRSLYDRGPHTPWLGEEMGTVRVRGDVTGITLRHCVFRETPLAIAAFPLADGQRIDEILIRDSEFVDCGDGGVDVNNGHVWKRGPLGSVGRVRVLRNRFARIGLSRTLVRQHMRAIGLKGPESTHIAGNVIEHTAGPGIDVWHGRPGSGSDHQLAKAAPVPLVRGLIHHNRVADSLLRIADYGGIESWGGGPVYVFGNISNRPVGYLPTKGWYHKNNAYYFDHQYKGYFFNNLGWSSDYERAWDGRLSGTFFKQAHGFLCYAFHNTCDNFRQFANAGISQQHARNRFLAKLVLRPMNNVFSHSGKGTIEWSTSAYGHHLIAGEPQEILGRYPDDQTDHDLDRFRAKLDEEQAMITGVGELVAEMPVQDVASHRLVPTPGSPAIDGGVQVFVPWGLAATVAEWHFHAHPADPALVVGESFWQSERHVAARGKDGYDRQPRGDLRLTATTLGDYVNGPLEDWTAGALVLDGERQGVATAPADHPATDLDMVANNFLIEAMLRVSEPGGAVASKLGGGSGYALRIDDDGHLVLDLLGGGGAAVALRSSAAVADDRWRHVVAEIDRSAGTARLYLDGELAAETGLDALGDAPLGNRAAFTVGAGVVGALDFLRVARGSLADARTDIGELYAWQFAGPHLHDFAGNPVSGEARDIGALEAP